MMGIYKIENVKNKKCYIGSSYNIKRRQYYHFSLLKRNKHPNKHLQHAYNFYGYEYFNFSIIEMCDQDSLINREQFWIDSLWDTGLYNVAKIAGASFKGRKHSNDTIEKMKKWQKINGNSMLGKKHDIVSKLRIQKSCTEKFKFRRKLTDDDVREVYNLHSIGIGAGKIAKKFKVSKPTIQKILKGIRYRSVPKT